MRLYALLSLRNDLLVPQLCHIHGERQHSLRGCSSQNDREVSDSATGGGKEADGSWLAGAPLQQSLTQHLVAVEHGLALLLDLLLPALLRSLHPLQHRVPPGLAAVHLRTHLL